MTVVCRVCGAGAYRPEHAEWCDRLRSYLDDTTDWQEERETYLLRLLNEITVAPPTGPLSRCNHPSANPPAAGVRWGGGSPPDAA